MSELTFFKHVKTAQRNTDNQENSNCHLRSKGVIKIRIFFIYIRAYLKYLKNSLCQTYKNVIQ